MAKEPLFYTIGPLPEIIVGSLSLPTYYLVLSLTYCVGIYWFYNRCEQRNLSPEKAMNISFILLGLGFVGARLTHVLFESPLYYLESPQEIFYFWQGGFVFYGGALLAYLGCYIYLRNNKTTFWLWHDTIAPVLALGYALGRSACFLVGCCYGKVCDLPWAVSVKQVHIASQNITHLNRHPTQLYAVVTELVILGFLLWYEKRRPQLGKVFLSWVFLHSLARIFMEFFRDDPRGPELYHFSLSTLISLGLIVFVGLVFNKSKVN